MTHSPTTPTNPAQGVSEAIDEGLEILVNLIDSITRHGNYTPESTCMFIDQAGAAFRAARANFVQTRASDARLVASAPGTVADEGAAIGAGGQAVAKPLDLSNLLKHAFSAGYVSAAGDDGWTDYDPTKCAAYSRILSALAHPVQPGWHK